MTSNRPVRLAIMTSALSLGLIACSDDASDADTADAGATDVGMTDTGGVDVGSTDAGTDDDVVTIGDVSDPDAGGGEARCPASVVIEAWPLNDAVTDGSVSIDVGEGGVVTATIDASAGGSQESRDNPFVYIDLDAGALVEITDVDSLSDTTWDIAFKRVVIRTNGGDSGPGGVSMAKSSGVPFDEVDGDTDFSAFETDVSFDQDCVPYVDPIGNVLAAINYLNVDNPTGSASWYSYEGGVSPVADDVYVVRTSEAFYKLEILAWSSGEYTLQWAEL